MRYSDHIIEEVKLRSSLSELVSERTEVKSSGRSFTACCPFHSEKTPSFHINEEQGLYYCFGCGKKGNTFTFVMETRGLTFPESVRFLAQRAGVNLPVQSEFKNENDKGVAKKKALLRRLVVEAQNLFEDILWDRRGSRKEGIVAREMLKERYISEQSVKRFRLGFSGSDQGLLLDELYKSIKDSLSITKEDVSQGLLELGLLREYDSGQKREFFRERVMFPISRSDGSPLAFGGRTIFTKPEIPKYINSPESSVYEKRRSFFGLSQGFASAQKARHVFIVEGYTDVISFSQVGLENTLAVCGTA
jgi:DNA primase